MEDQRKFSDYLMEVMGLDRAHCAIGETEHPFTLGFNTQDLRITTHYLEEAEALSDRVGIMKDGRLLALGTPEELKRQAGCDRFEDAFIAMVREAGR